MKTNQYWFRPKKWGWGFTPITWEGWLATLVLVGVLLTSAWINNFFEITGPNGKQAAQFFFDMILIILVTTPYMLKGTKGEVKWNFGTANK